MDAERDIISERYYHGIDIIALLSYIFKRCYFIAIAAVIGAVVGGYYVTHFATPVYQATSKIYLAGSETSISIADLQLGSSLAVDYQELFKISDTHERVAEILGLDYPYDQLYDMVSVSVPSNSHVMYINVKSSDPEEAMLLANTYAEVAQDYITDRMEMKRPLLLERARKPSSPLSPNIRTVVKDSAVMGGFIPAIVLALLYLVSNRIRSEKDITAAVDLPVLGSLPLQRFGREHTGRLQRETSISFPRSIRQAETKQSDSPQAVIRVIPETDNHYSESLNSICSGISFAKNNLKTIAVTSCGEGEGKTLTAFQLSIGMAKRGRRTLLMDCDLRKSVMKSRYRIRLKGKGVGLAHLLSGQCELSDAVYATNISNLFLIPVGELINTPLALILSSEFDDVLNRLRDSFDMIIIDTPPVGTVIDAAEVAHRCDGSILVVESRKTQARMLKTAAERMRQTEALILGCILNKVKTSRWKNAAYEGCKGEKRGVFQRLFQMDR